MDDIEHCDICGRKCDGVHNTKINNEEKKIQQIVNILISHNENIVNEVIKRVSEIQRLKSEKA
jgi:hypothetical protein